MKFGSAAGDILNVLTGKTAVQTQSAVTVDTGTQQWITQLAIGAAAVMILLFWKPKK